MLKLNTKYKIETSSGFEHFHGIQKSISNTLINFHLENSIILRVTPNHRFLTNEGFIEAQNINTSHTITGKSIKKIETETGNFHVYDPIEVDKHNTYIVSDIVSHNCEFLGSSNTLIDPAVIARMAFKPPIHSKDHIDVWEPPIKSHKYLCVADTSRGVGMDYSAFCIFDITQVPYKIVAKYRDDEISPLIYPNIIYQMCTHYNEALVLIEINDIGQQIADILHNDLEYEGVIVTQVKGRAGQKIGGGFGKNRPQFGVRTTSQVKRIGCGNLKSMIEGNKLLFDDYDLIFELTRFIAVKNSYEAEEGYHDDLVMCCVLFAWMVNQVYFKEISDTDVRSRLLDDQHDLLNDDMTPFGFIDDGHPEDEEISQPDFYSLEF